MHYQDNFNTTISDDELFADILEERKERGYYNLALQEVSAYKEYAKSVKQSHIVVIGIGGSTLGTYAIYKYLKHSRDLSKELHFLETTDPLDIKSKLSHIPLEDSLFIVISKSGTTVETISLFKYLHTLIKIDKTNTVIVSESDSKLTSYASFHDMQTFEIPKNVGGRFSVFSAVGLLPLAIVGIDIDSLMQGVQRSYDSFFSKDTVYKKILKKARFFVEYKNKFNVNVLFSYSSRLEGLNKWYVQLWGESLGKVDVNNTRQGLTPVGIIGPIDQHSFLQLIVEGRRDKTVTIIKVENFDNHFTIPDITLEGLEELDYLNNLEFSSLINMQADSTIEALNELNDVPCDVITLDGICESSIASLMYEYELLTSVCAKFMYINAYDQPGVESGKIILKNKLKQK